VLSRTHRYRFYLPFVRKGPAHDLAPPFFPPNPAKPSLVLPCDAIHGGRSGVRKYGRSDCRLLHQKLVLCVMGLRQLSYGRGPCAPGRYRRQPKRQLAIRARYANPGTSGRQTLHLDCALTFDVARWANQERRRSAGRGVANSMATPQGDLPYPGFERQSSVPRREIIPRARGRCMRQLPIDIMRQIKCRRQVPGVCPVTPQAHGTITMVPRAVTASDFGKITIDGCRRHIEVHSPADLIDAVGGP